jgi:hypothetical protein
VRIRDNHDNATNATVFFIGTESGGYNFVKGLDFVFLSHDQLR